jgi:hypothetical protein
MTDSEFMQASTSELCFRDVPFEQAFAASFVRIVRPLN